MPLDETGVRDASYGPAGLITTGAAFEKRDVKRLAESYRKLKPAINRLPVSLRAALLHPYLADEADPGIVEVWRERIAALDKENTTRRKARKPEKVAHVYTRRQLQRHDIAVHLLWQELKDENLYVVYPKLMSERERAAGEAANAQMMAYYQRVRVAGRTHRGAISQTAVKFEIPEDAVERVVEFRSDVKLASCAERGCGRAVFQQNLCQRHYQRDWRARKNRNVS